MPTLQGNSASTLAFLSGGLNAGAHHTAGLNLVAGGANLYAGGLQLLTAAPQSTATFVAHAAQQPACVAAAGGEFAGLRAAHEAEIRTATILTARAQQDAELRTTIAALDRARGSMSSAMGGVAPDSASTAAATKELVNVAAKTAANIALLTEQLDRVEARIGAVEKDVTGLIQIQKAIIQHVGQMPKPASAAEPAKTQPTADSIKPKN